MPVTKYSKKQTQKKVQQLYSEKLQTKLVVSYLSQLVRTTISTIVKGASCKILPKNSPAAVFLRLRNKKIHLVFN